MSREKFESDLFCLLEAKGDATRKILAAGLHNTDSDRAKAREAENEFQNKLQDFVAKWNPTSIQVS